MSELNELFSKADITTGAGSAAGGVGDFLPTPLYNQFIEYLREATFVRDLFKSVNMTNKVLDIPTVDAGTSVYYQATEAADAEATDISSSVVRLESKKLMAQVIISKEVLEDTNNNIQKVVTQDFAKALAAAEENAFLLGATSPGTGNYETAASGAPTTAAHALATVGTLTNAHTGVATDPKNICNGVAQNAIAVASNGNVINGASASFYGTQAYTLIRQAVSKLGILGRNKKDLALIVNNVSGSQLLMSEELMTLEKYGANATILSGEVGQLFGIKVIESSFLPSGEVAVDTDAVVEGASIGAGATGYGIGANVLLVHVPSFVIGDRRKVSIQSEDVIASDAIRIVLTSRVAFNSERAGAAVLIGNLDSEISTEQAA